LAVVDPGYRSDPKMKREVAERFERARRRGNEPSRKLHTVPSSYLERWTDASNLLRVTDVNNRSTFCGPPRKIAREVDFYNLSSPDLDPREIPPMLFEMLLGEIEGRAVPLISRLIEEGAADTFSAEELAHLVTYLAFQFTRGPRFRAWIEAQTSLAMRVHAWTQDEDDVRRSLGDDATEDQIREGITALDHLRAGTVFVEPQRAQSVGIAGKSAEAVYRFFAARRWVVYSTSRPLITCDEPVVLVCGPDTPRAWRCGVGNAALILFPLSPHALLAMFQPDFSPALEHPHELSALEVADINLEMTANAHRWVFSLASQKHFNIPLVPPPPMQAIHSIAPSLEPDRALVGFHQPTRWMYATEPPWPVARWWV
jgi:hypothetical protein